MKKSICLLLTACMVFSMTGCGKNGNTALEEQAGGQQIESQADDASVETPTGEGTDELDEEASSSEGDAAKADEQVGNEPEYIQPIVAKHSVYISRPYDWATAITARWSEVLLDKEEAKKWPNLARALANYSADANLSGQNVTDSMRELMIEDLQWIKTDAEGEDAFKFTEEEWPPTLSFEDNSDLKMARSDENAFSFMVDYYSYMGGAHPYYAYYGYNFDSETGKELDAADVVTDVSKLNTILYDKLFSEYKELDLDEGTVNDCLYGYVQEGYGHTWVLGMDGVTFYFNPYTLTSYAGGAQEIHILFSEYPDLFVEKYTKAPSEYVLYLGENGFFEADVDRDGDREKVSVWANDYYDEADYGAFEFDVMIDDQSYKFDDYYDGEKEAYYVHTKNGSYIYNWVYIYESQVACIYDLTSSKPVANENVFTGYTLCRGSDYGYEDYEHEIHMSYDTTYIEAFVNPNKVRMGQYTDALSTGSGMRTYHMSDDGMLVSDDEFMDVSYSWFDYFDEAEAGYKMGFEFTTKVDLKMDLLKPNGEVGKKEMKVPAGSKLSYLRTDGESIAEFRMEDGSVVRAKIQVGDWPQYISGVELEEALDGIVFAG